MRGYRKLRWCTAALGGKSGLSVAAYSTLKSEHAAVLKTAINSFQDAVKDLL